MRQPPRRSGFTLIEVLAAVFLTAVVMTVAIAFFVTLSDSTDAAARKARQGRLALAVVDRIARDLEGAYLLTAPRGVDPLFHPWIFIAQNEEGESASDRVQFVTRSHRPRNPLGHGSDLAVITYLLHPADDALGFELLRAVRPGVPDEAEHDFLPAGDELFRVVAEHIDHFGLRFMSEDFEWHDEWDSSQLEQAGELPRAAEIELAFLDVNPDDLEAADDLDGLARLGPSEGAGETTPYTRRVALPMRAIDLAAMLDEAAADAFGQELAEAEAEQAAEKEAAATEGGGDDEREAGDSPRGPRTSARAPGIRIDLSGGGNGGGQ